MTTIDSLAYETLDQVTELLHQPRPWHPDLLSSALVCRRWRDLAQRALFAECQLDEDSRARHWINSEARATFRCKRLGVSLKNGAPPLLPFVTPSLVGDVGKGR